jgi:cytochrome c biogenesis protein CcdA
VTLILSLVVLALLDSTSIGTLFIPVLLMLRPGRLRAAPLLGYLATIAVFYLALGIAIALGAGPLVARAGSALGPAGHWLELVAGVALFALSFRFDPKRRRPDAGRRWTERVHRAVDSPRALAVLALTAGLLEAATMFPYLGAIALLAGAGLGAGGTAAVLAGYCVVMVLPALVLLALRRTLSARITPVLERLNGWFEKHAVGATGWILAIVGFMLAADGATQLGLLDALRD